MNWKQEAKEYAVLIPMALIVVYLGWPGVLWTWFLWLALFVAYAVAKLKDGPFRRWLRR